MISVGSTEEAEFALNANDFDLAVIAAAQSKGVSIISRRFLRDGKGKEIPVIEFRAPDGSLLHDEPSRIIPEKSCGSIEELVAIVRDRLATRPQLASMEAA